MRKLLKGNLAQKIILVLIIAILCNFIIPNYSQALDGNILLDPFKMLFAFIGDCAISIVQWSITGVYIGAGSAKAKPANDQKDNWATNGEGEIDWPTIIISPEEIITGKVSMLNANFIKGVNETTPGDTNGDGVPDYVNPGGSLSSDLTQFREDVADGKKISTAVTEEGLSKLRKTISQWYNLLRNIAAAALFCVLIYMGIRILLTSVSEEKAKYKKMLVDWLAALCILFFLHYIMALIMFATDKIVEVIGNGLGSNSYQVKFDDDVQKFTLTKSVKGDDISSNGSSNGSSGDNNIEPENLMEQVRVYVSADDRGIAFSYLLLYVALIVVTYIFLFKYIKRFITMALLTLIAPIIAVTYPIDKVKDGQAQAFSMWFREYMFNALLQPIHLLIYMVLVGSASELVQSNIIYAIVAMLSILPAEKLIKSMFGFDKSSTTDGIGNFAKGALASKAVNALASRSKSSSKSSSSSGSSSGSGSSSSKIRQKDSKGLDAYTNSEDNPSLNEGNSNTANNNVNMANMPTGSQQGENNDSSATGARELPPPGTYNDNSATGARVLSPQGTVATNSKKARNTKKKIKMPKRLKGVAKVAGKGIKYTAKKLPSIARTMAKGVGGLAGGALGVGAAMVTGDLSHIATGVAAGVGVGSLAAGAASGVAGAASGVVNAGRGIRSAYREGALGEDAAEKLERFEAYKRDNENIEAFQKQFKNADGSELSKKQAKAKVEEARDFIEAGYTDAKEIKKLMKMRDTGVTSDQAMAAHQQAETYGVDYFMDEKKIDNLENRVTNQIMTDAGISNETKARQLAQQHINLMATSKGQATIDWDKRDIAKKEAKVQAEKEKDKAKAEAERNAQFQEAIINLANSSKGKEKEESNNNK